MKIVDNQNTKKKVTYFVIIVVLFVLLFALFSFDLFKGNKPSHSGRPVASVDGFVIYESDLTNRLSTLSPDKKVKLEDLPEGVLKAMVLEVAVNHKIDQEAKKMKYQNDPRINEYVENYKKGLIREKYLNDNVYSKVTNEDTLNEYNALINNLKDKEERKIKHILVENEEEIERIRRRVMRTGNFEKIAKEKSIDTASGENGGDIGYVLREELVPEFADVAFILKPGEVSKPVKTQYGWHIIKVEDVRPAQFLPFNDVKDSIKQRLQQQAIQDYLISLTKDSNIDYKIKVKKLPDENAVEDNSDGQEVREDLVME